MMENRKCVILSIGVTLAICGMLCSSFWGRYSMFDNYFLLFPVSLGICLVTITAILSFLTKKKIFSIICSGCTNIYFSGLLYRSI